MGIPIPPPDGGFPPEFDDALHKTMDEVQHYIANRSAQIWQEVLPGVDPHTATRRQVAQFTAFLASQVGHICFTLGALWRDQYPDQPIETAPDPFDPEDLMNPEGYGSDRAN